MNQKKNTFKKIVLKSIRNILITLYLLFIISMIAGGLIAGSMTLTPSEGLGWTVSKVNYIGYMSVCSFVPFSTIMLFGMAGLGLLLLFKLVKYLRR